MTADIARIKEMESILDECSETIASLRDEVDKMRSFRDSMTKLFDYYGSEEWYEDREGEIPEDVKAGVLSEDLVYDTITEERDASFDMIELGTDILKAI